MMKYEKARMEIFFFKEGEVFAISSASTNDGSEGDSFADLK